MTRSCFFIGHKESEEAVIPVLREAIEKHITEYGVTVFYVGGYGGFDRVVAGELVRAKKAHPEICLIRLLPYHPAERPVETPDGFDNTFHPEGMERVPRKYAIARANRYMVDNVDHLIAYVWHGFGNSNKILQHALARQKRGLIKVTLLNDGVKA